MPPDATHTLVTTSSPSPRLDIFAHVDPNLRAEESYPPFKNRLRDMRIGIPLERPSGERRVAATPTTVPKLIKLGYEVAVERSAGVDADYSDDAYMAAGAQIVSAEEAWASDIVVTFSQPEPYQLDMMRPGAISVAFYAPRQNPDVAAIMAQRHITAMSMDMVPRISRAQSLDALSSMANIAGYRAVVEASHAFGRFFTGQVTAAGKIPSAKVLVIGAGVAGLAAIGAAHSMGAQVFATDTRPEVADQVESMGGTFLNVEDSDAEVSATGYAKEMSDDYNARAAKLYEKTAKEVDIIITTAAIPGRPSPKLITSAMVASMKPGSVIVDLAALGGGNCEDTIPGRVVTTANQVTIVGYTDMAGRMPAQASELYGNNIVNLVKLLTPNKDGQADVNFDDEVLRSMTISRDGNVTFPPPEIKVSAATSKLSSVTVPEEPASLKRQTIQLSGGQKFGAITALGLGWLLLAMVLPLPFLGHIMTFGLACIVGYYVITNVEPALYTPLMSVSNAISGITIVGAITQLTHDSIAVKILAFIAIIIAGINMFGGFAITQRMLQMFRKGN